MPGVHFIDARGPEGVRLYAIGDIHGRLDLLEAMYEKIEDDRRDAADWRIVHLGDYVDRGPDSRGVIDAIIRASEGGKVTAIAGNHDIAFLDFIATPDARGLFARFGGDATARSYGVEIAFEPQWLLKDGHRALVAAVPDAHVEFLQVLKLSFDAGYFFFCHAGIRPGVELDRQDAQDLVWIRDVFLGHPGLHPKVIVHGHTPADEPEVLANRVNVDTGAYFSGVLTALVIDGAEKRLLQAKR
ncbi:MAG: metallophosphoesterase family protein [Rhizobiaceae bacterium]